MTGSRGGGAVRAPGQAFPNTSGVQGSGARVGHCLEAGRFRAHTDLGGVQGVLVRTVAQTWGAETPRASEVKVWQAGLQNKENLDNRGRRKGVQPRPGPQWAHLAPGSTIPGNT